jgi:hypothetical protein
MLEFGSQSWDSEMGLITVLTTYPLIMNHLAFCCFETLEVLDIKHIDHLRCKSGVIFSSDTFSMTDTGLDLSPVLQVELVDSILSLPVSRLTRCLEYEAIYVCMTDFRAKCMAKLTK